MGLKTALAGAATGLGLAGLVTVFAPSTEEPAKAQKAEALSSLLNQPLAEAGALSTLFGSSLPNPGKLAVFTPEIGPDGPVKTNGQPIPNAFKSGPNGP